MKYRLSVKAAGDLRSITEYTLRMWGERQASLYLASLARHFQAIVETPYIGKLLEPGGTSRALVCGSHVIYYREQSGAILVRRVLHKSMAARRHLAP